MNFEFLLKQLRYGVCLQRIAALSKICQAHNDNGSELASQLDDFKEEVELLEEELAVLQQRREALIKRSLRIETAVRSAEYDKHRNFCQSLISISWNQ